MQKPRFSMRLTSIMLVFIILFSLWNPSMFALGEEEQGEEEQNKPTQVEALNEEGEEDGSDQDQEEVKEGPKKEESEEEEKEEVKEEAEETPESEEDKPKEKKKEEEVQEKKEEELVGEDVKEEKKDKKDKEEEQEEAGEEEQEDKLEDQGLEYYPSILEPAIPLPRMAQSMARVVPMNSNLEDTIEVNKWARRLKGLCRVFEVNLEITGEPQEAPVDVVLVIDRSGSMNESSGRTNDYFPIVAEPANNQTYYVKVGNGYQEVSYHPGGILSDAGWRYGRIGNRRYVKWDPNGNDSAAGGNNANSAVGKPFYVRGNSRLYYAKQAAVNFAAKVLGPNGIAGSRVSLVTFSGPSTTTRNGEQNQAQTVRGLTDNLTQLTSSINGITAEGGTNTEAGFLQGRSVIENSNNPNSNKVVIMFTDGLPTASNGNRYARSTNVNHVHNQRALSAGKGIFQDGVADVFTIGLLQGMNNAERNLALHILEETQNKGWYEAPTAADLDQIFNDIATQLGYAATNAKVVDKIGDNFDLLPESLPVGATYDPSTREISWNPGTIVEEASLKYQVRAKPEFSGGNAKTNEYAELKYTDIFGNNNQKKDFPEPVVDVPTLLEVNLTDAEIILGESIKLGTGTDSNGENYMSEIIGGDGNGTYTYEWRIKGSNQIISTEKHPQVSPTVDTEYELTVIDSNGCKAVATMKVKVRKLQVTIKKAITGNYADYDEDFDFTLWINNESPHNFSLGHNEEEIFKDIAKGSTLKLKEESQGYEVRVKVGSTEYEPNSNGFYEIPVGEEDITIVVTNHKETEVDTGISLDTLPYILVITLAAGGLGFMIVRRRKLHD